MTAHTPGRGFAGIEKDLFKIQWSRRIVVGSRKRIGPALPIPIDDLVPGDGEKPRRHFLDGLCNTVACGQLIENILQNIFRVRLVAHSLADKIQ